MASPIPKGLNHLAQGCEQRATLGVQFASLPTLKELYPPVQRQFLGKALMQPISGRILGIGLVAVKAAHNLRLKLVRLCRVLGLGHPFGPLPQFLRTEPTAIVGSTSELNYLGPFLCRQPLYLFDNLGRCH